MKRIRRLVAVVLTMLFMLQIQNADDIAFASESTEKIVVSFGVSNSDAVARNTNLLSCQEYDDGVYGPQAFCIDGNDIYILDTLGKRIVASVGQQILVVDLGESFYPTDVIYIDEKFYVHDAGLGELQIYELDGDVIYRDAIPLEDGSYVKRLSVAGGDVIVETYDDLRLKIDSSEEHEWVIEKESSDKEVLQNQDYDFVAYIDRDSNGNRYTINTRLVQGSCLLDGEISIHGITEGGEELGSYIIDRSEFVYLPEQFVEVTDAGEIYLMVPTEDAVEIRKIVLTDEPISRYAEIAEAVFEREKELYTEKSQRTLSSRSAVISLSRSEVYSRASAMSLYEWSLTEDNVDNADELGATLPAYIQTIVGEQDSNETWSVSMKGLPYCWGGFHTQYNSYQGKTFDEGIEEGYLAGNIKCSGNYKSGTVGVDCSGFLSAAYGLTTRRTTYSSSGSSDFYHFGTELTEYGDMMQGDFLVKKGHVMMFVISLNAESGIFLATEATKAAGEVVSQVHTLNDLLGSGYIMRTPW